MEYQYLAVNLRALRLEARLSQHQLALRAGDGFTQRYLSELERGLWPYDPTHVARLAVALGVQESALVRRARRRVGVAQSLERGHKQERPLGG
jgi:transcriptional regulator with XRE-family HTH domain